MNTKPSGQDNHGVELTELELDRVAGGTLFRSDAERDARSGKTKGNVEYGWKIEEGES